MDDLTFRTPVGEWVTRRPNVSRVFEEFQIDYCCGGNVPLAQACDQRGLDPRQLLAKLEAAMAAEGDAPSWPGGTLSELCDHIEQVHHDYLRTELPRLQQIIAKVAKVHGANHPEMVEVRDAFAALQAELEPHMFKEEHVLFPAIRMLEQSSRPPIFPFGTIANPIRRMEMEHDHAGDALAQIRHATDNYRVPDDACNTFRAMLSGLERLELDMHQHVHKENSILFPRAIAKERELSLGS